MSHVEVLERMLSDRTVLLDDNTLGSDFYREELTEEAAALTEALRVMRGWMPIESAPETADYWIVWSAYYKRPVVVTNRMDDNTYWEGDWDYDVQATHWWPALPPAGEPAQESSDG
jgi:hypothetical protein